MDVEKHLLSIVDLLGGFIEAIRKVMRRKKKNNQTYD